MNVDIDSRDIASLKRAPSASSVPLGFRATPGSRLTPTCLIYAPRLKFNFIIDEQQLENNRPYPEFSREPGEPEVVAGINITPLVDIMLVIAIPIQLHSINMNMPVGNPPPLKPPDIMRVDVTYPNLQLKCQQSLIVRGELVVPHSPSTSSGRTGGRRNNQ